MPVWSRLQLQAGHRKDGTRLLARRITNRFALHLRDMIPAARLLPRESSQCRRRHDTAPSGLSRPCHALHTPGQAISQVVSQSMSRRLQLDGGRVHSSRPFSLSLLQDQGSRENTKYQSHGRPSRNTRLTPSSGTSFIRFLEIGRPAQSRHYRSKHTSKPPTQQEYHP